MAAAWVIWLGIIIQVLPHIKDLMRQAEKLFDDIPDSGEQKKQYVMAMVKEIAEALTNVTGPEWDAVWAKVEASVSSFIDIFCPFLFKDDEEVISNA